MIEKYHPYRRIQLILCCTALIFATDGIKAQHLGIKTGYIADISKIEYPDVKATANDGFQIGAELDIPFRYTGLGIKTNLLYASHGFKLREDYGNDSGVTFYFRTNSLELPVVLYKEFNVLLFKSYVKGGLYASYSLSGKIKDGISATQFDLNGSSRIDYGTVLGIGIKVLPKLAIDADFSHGLNQKKYQFGNDMILQNKGRITFSLVYYLL